jgi:hypothetical protein
MKPRYSDSNPMTKTSVLKSGALVFFGVSAVVFASRLPFLQAGYGNDPDAWRVVNAARHIAITRKYEASRLPGYPIEELSYSLIYKGGPLALNGLTALLSAFAAAFFALSLRELRCKDYALASLALAFTPVVFINSTNSMDYLWALSFMLASLYFAITGQALAAGISLGIAIGCRITSALLLPPLWVMLAAPGGRRGQSSSKRVLVFSAGALLIGGIAYLPVVLRYGFGFFTHYEHGYPSLFDVLGKATVAVWGLIGLVAIAASLASLVVRRGGSKSSIPSAPLRRYDLAWAIAIALYCIAYVRLPHQSGYLIPVVPFVLILLGRILQRRAFLLVCFSLLLSPLLASAHAWTESAEPPVRMAVQSQLFNHPVVLALPGPIFFDRLVRLAAIKYVETVVAAAKSLPHRSVIVAGWWLPQVQASIASENRSGVHYVYVLGPSRMQKYLARGYRLYYLRGADEYSLAVYGVDLVERGAVPLAVGRTG